MWNERYSQAEYVYGKHPNDFLVEVVQQIPKGQVLCLADGEGRNGVYLAQQGYQVTAVDASSVGLEKARKLSAERSVEIETIIADLAEFPIQPNSWNAIVSIFCHLPPIVRAHVHRQVVSGLRSGGVFVLEAYTPRQLQFKTGGPPTAELTVELTVLQQELEGLEFKHAVELERDIQEGLFHQGRSSVVQVVAMKA
ncbi:MULTISPECIES: class I SAM-dependent methyltransferase [Leptolyngbya]|uniref:class I SAM-dependent methyltransferase n=1 Tax=Leptolyngbya TaxID=47251 RepID=UPI001682BD66|nr:MULTISPECIES: class I SAM-dependent methyltransferase [unclassified Leptolyngbya]MBD1860040.1 class I SAM-dependent methyltransferase [Leptolyngbya sp. FACHB-1624]MBN8563616.1 class I SAM-dependent methyltransferase [Leptolyngbya sp. UWPOB_LEPTO1]